MKVNFHITDKSEVICVIRAQPIPHCPITTLPLIPHTQQRWVAGIDKVDDPHIGLGRVLAVQSARVLLQGPLPRHRHGQHQGIQRRMIKPFTDQLAGRQQDTRRIRWQRAQFLDECRALLLGYSPVQDKQLWHLVGQGSLYGIEMFGALGQHQHLAALAVSADDLPSNRIRSCLINGKVPEYILNPRILR